MRYRNWKVSIFKSETVDIFVIFDKTSNFVTISVVGFELVVIPKSTGAAKGLTLNNIFFYEIVVSKNNKFEKNYERAQQNVNSSENFYRKSFRDNVIDKKECDSLCNSFTNL